MKRRTAGVRRLVDTAPAAVSTSRRTPAVRRFPNIHPLILDRAFGSQNANGLWSAGSPAFPPARILRGAGGTPALPKRHTHPTRRGPGIILAPPDGGW